jgi:hypothetical protein
MEPQTEGLSILQLFDQALRLECEVPGIFLREDGHRQTILAETGAQLTINHKTDHIVLNYHNSRLQRASYIMHEAEGERFSTTNHPLEMDADHAAKYLIERLLRDEIP